MRCTPPIAKAFFSRKYGSILLTFGLLSVPLFSVGATVTTPPVGYVKTTLLAASDTFIAPTLTRPPEYIGTVESATVATLGVSGDPQWEVGMFAYQQGVQSNHYYARLGAAPEGQTNPFEGRTFEIESGYNNVVIVTDPLNGDLSTVPVGTKIEIIPYWTLGTLFPPEDAGVTFEASPSAFNRKTQLYFPDKTSAGINLSSAEIYYYANEKWRRVGASATADFGDKIVEPQCPITLRNNNTGAVDREFFLEGNVLTGKSSVLIRSQALDSQDNAVNLSLPVPTTLKSLGLVTSGVFQVSPNAFNRKDTLLIFSNETAEVNKSYIEVFYYANDAWRKVGSPAATSFDLQEISPNVRIIFRKVPDNIGNTLIWTSETL